MYYGRKKGIITAVIIVLVVLVLAGVGFYIFACTDLLKSNQSMFLKYAGQAIDDLKYVENEQLSSIDELKKEKMYTIEGTLNGESNFDQSVGNTLNKLQFKINASVDEENAKTYGKVNVVYNNNDIFNVEYANKDKIYALRSNEIVTAFIGIENSNLKVLAQKLGITDTANIPNEIKKVDINSVLAITEEEKEYLYETYGNILIKNIDEKNFTKENDLMVTQNGVSHKTTAYRLKLNYYEMNQLQIALLEELKQDSITLNMLSTKAKALGIDEEHTAVNTITEKIQKIIDEKNNNTNYNDENGISITIYVDNGEVVSTEIIFRNEAKYTIYGSNAENTSKRYLLIENLTTSDEYSKIEIQENETRTSDESSYNIIINIDNKKGINIYLDNIGSSDEENLQTTCEVTINEADKETILNYEQEMKFTDEDLNIPELSRNNCGVLNDYSIEQVKPLVQAISLQTQAVLNQKLKLIDLGNYIIDDWRIITKTVEQNLVTDNNNNNNMQTNQNQ